MQTREQKPLIPRALSPDGLRKLLIVTVVTLWWVLLAPSASAAAKTAADLGFHLPHPRLQFSGPTPEAHWLSEKQIQLHYPSFRPSQDLKFELVSDAPMAPIPLPLLSHRGNLWNLAADNLQRDIAQWIRRPLWVRIVESSGREIFRTTLRLTGLLDQRFSDTKRRTGLHWPRADKPELRVWVPTSMHTELLLFDSPEDTNPQVVPLQEESLGFWSITGDSTWEQKYYLYRVTRFSPRSGRVETVESTDPASVSVSAEGQRSQIINLEDPRWMPVGWQNLQKPRLGNLTDSVIYEIHLRDFTAGDPGLTQNERGTYMGLVSSRSKAFQHLNQLAAAGLTHIHLLPILDFAGVPEMKAGRLIPRIPQNLGSDSEIPQHLLGQSRDKDAYNWGYNPVHWMLPEGGYAQDPVGPARILELRTLVQRMNQIGLRVVLDVVYNHTFAAFEDEHSVFDRLVPYYYHRYNERGELMSSSCCADIATENRMVEKLMLDSLKVFAKDYKIDGFRFDLMNLHPTAQVPRIREFMDAMTLQNSGIEGSKILVYGEAWPFGSLEELQPGAAFTQVRSHGWGVGVFNDRMRDALRGGTTDSREKSDPGFATGLFWDFNFEPANTNSPSDSEGQRQKLLHLGDVVKIGLAGNLRDVVIRDHLNHDVRAGDLFFRNSPVGYAAEPIETINYVSAHDGYALWDAVQAKMPFQSWSRSPGTASLTERMRVQRLMLGTILLSQGIPFFEGGSELLRSKSGDVDSYDSGDHFNQIDWSLTSNNWGGGLPPSWKNLADWNFWRPRLQDPSLKVGPAEILSTKEYFLSLLRLRKDNPLLRLSTATEIRQLVSFPVNERNGGDTPGLVAMLIEDANPPIDPTRRSLIVLINVANQSLIFQNARLSNQPWRWPVEFGPAQDADLGRSRWDSSQGLFEVPARSLMVLEEPR